MDTKIFYYTGTGNSLWVSQRIGKELGGAELISVPYYDPETVSTETEMAGIVFPVHIWGLPGQIVRFIENISRLHASYIFALAINAGQVSNTLVQLKSIMKKKNLDLSCGFQIRMPSNYIPWGGPGPEERQKKLFEEALNKMSYISSVLKKRMKMPVEKGPLWQRVLFTAVYKSSFSHVRNMDRKFRADEKCNSCGICARICPAGNIEIIMGRPTWKHNCEQCFACLQWCPSEAIQYGRMTSRHQRYHHPEIRLEHMLQKY